MIDMVKNSNNPAKNQSQAWCGHPDQRQPGKKDFDMESLRNNLKKVDTDLFYELLSEKYSVG